MVAAVTAGSGGDISKTPNFFMIGRGSWACVYRGISDTDTLLKVYDLELLPQCNKEEFIRRLEHLKGFYSCINGNGILTPEIINIECCSNRVIVSESFIPNMGDVRTNNILMDTPRALNGLAISSGPWETFAVNNRNEKNRWIEVLQRELEQLFSDSNNERVRLIKDNPALLKRVIFLKNVLGRQASRCDAVIHEDPNPGNILVGVDSTDLFYASFKAPQYTRIVGIIDWPRVFGVGDPVFNYATVMATAGYQSVTQDPWLVKVWFAMGEQFKQEMPREDLASLYQYVIYIGLVKWLKMSGRISNHARAIVPMIADSLFSRWFWKQAGFDEKDH